MDKTLTLFIKTYLHAKETNFNAKKQFLMQKETLCMQEMFFNMKQ